MTIASQLLESGALAALSPRFAAGLQRVREVTDSDGALPAWLKALSMAGAATVKGYPETARRELQRGAELGLSRSYAEGAMLALLISRGEAVAHTFVGLIEDVFGPAAQHDLHAAATVSVSSAEARAYFERTFGSVPAYVELLARGAPRALEGYFLMREVAVAQGALAGKFVDLFYVTINACEFMAWNVGLHARSARKAGATDLELIEAGVCAIPIAGAPAWIAAADGLTRPEG